MPDNEAFFRRVNAMTKEEQDHFQMVLEKLVLCYGPNPAQAVIVFTDSDEPMAETMTLNCDETEAFGLVQSVRDYLYLLATKNTPPKEKLN